MSQNVPPSASASAASPRPPIPAPEPGKSGARQQARLECRGAGRTASLAGTAADTAGVFEAKMAKSGSKSSLELKRGAAGIKASKGSGESGLSLAGRRANPASKGFPPAAGAGKSIKLSASLPKGRSSSATPPSRPRPRATSRSRTA